MWPVLDQLPLGHLSICKWQFPVQWGDCKKSWIVPFNVIIIIIIIIIIITDENYTPQWYTGWWADVSGTFMVAYSK